VRSPGDLERAFAEMRKASAGAVVVGGSGMLFSHRGRIAELAVKHGLPTVCGTTQYVEAGCLVAYAASFGDLSTCLVLRRRILKGAPPANLPVEQPTKFELAINIKTADALGLTIPRSLLVRADQIKD
jgi:putative ABC transport system substrate-binding protein